MTLLFPRNQRRSRFLFDSTSRWAIERNSYAAITEQVSTASRTSVAAAIASDGTLQVAGYGQPRFSWVDLDGDGILETATLLLEDTRTNVVIHKRDLSNASWTKVTATAVRDQVGIDGVANSASSLLATAGNATCLQAITLGSSARAQSAWIKRLIGSGNVQMTTDGGSTWTTVTINANAYTLVTIPTQTVVNPSVGFRLVTNGDKIAVDWVQNETGNFATSSIGTVADNTATETRSADALSFAVNIPPRAMTIYVKFVESGTILTGSTNGLVGIGASTNPAFLIFNDSTGHYQLMHRRASDVTSTAAAAPTLGQTVELRGLLNADGSVQLGQSINGAAEVVAAASAANALAAAWNNTTLTINERGGNLGFAKFIAVRIAAGIQSLAFMREG